MFTVPLSTIVTWYGVICTDIFNYLQSLLLAVVIVYLYVIFVASVVQSSLISTSVLSTSSKQSLMASLGSLAESPGNTVCLSVCMCVTELSGTIFNQNDIMISTDKHIA